MLSYKILGSNIQKARRRCGMSQEQVATCMGITSNYYGRFERGEIRPSLKRLEEICEILSIPIEEIFIGAYDKNSYKGDPLPDTTINSFLHFLHCGDEKEREAITRICEGIISLTRHE